MQSLRVINGVEVEVNDLGDKIILQIEDQEFIEKFYGIIDSLDAISKEINAKEIKELSLREQNRIMSEKTKLLMRDVDTLFGANCCQKVFGDIVPSPYLFMQFFEHLEPIIKQYANDRKKEIAAKYNRNRKGANSNKYRTKEQIIQDEKR